MYVCVCVIRAHVCVYREYWLTRDREYFLVEETEPAYQSYDIWHKAIWLLSVECPFPIRTLIYQDIYSLREAMKDSNLARYGERSLCMIDWSHILIHDTDNNDTDDNGCYIVSPFAGIFVSFDSPVCIPIRNVWFRRFTTSTLTFLTRYRQCEIYFDRVMVNGDICIERKNVIKQR